MNKIKGRMPNEIVMPDNMAEFYSTPKDEIEYKADQLARTFIDGSRIKPSDDQWVDKYKKEALRLLWQCHHKIIAPPVSLVVLVSCLFGDRHNISHKKFSLLHYLAENYEPIKPGQRPPRGLISAAAKEINRYGGLIDNPRPVDQEKGNESSDHRKTVKGLLDDPLFCDFWAAYRVKYKNSSCDINPERLKMIEVIFSARE